MAGTNQPLPDDGPTQAWLRGYSRCVACGRTVRNGARCDCDESAAPSAPGRRERPDDDFEDRLADGFDLLADDDDEA